MATVIELKREMIRRRNTGAENQAANVVSQPAQASMPLDEAIERIREAMDEYLTLLAVGHSIGSQPSPPQIWEDLQRERNIYLVERRSTRNP